MAVKGGYANRVVWLTDDQSRSHFRACGLRLPPCLDRWRQSPDAGLRKIRKRFDEIAGLILPTRGAAGGNRIL